MYKPDARAAGLCDHGSNVWIDDIIPLSPTYRLLPLGTSQWTVAETLSYTVPALEQKLLTINTFNVPESNPVSISYWIDEEIQTAEDVSEVNPLTEWCDLESSLDATQEIQVSNSEKYKMICWTADENRHSPASIIIPEDVQTINAHYVGASKQLSHTEAQIGEKVTVTLQVINIPTGASSDSVQLTDDLPHEMSYIVGSATVDGTPINPIITTLEDPEAHEQLIFTVDGNQKHTIVYETIITRAYSSDMIVENEVIATFNCADVDPVSIEISSTIIIHPYQGETLSKIVEGPSEVQMFTERARSTDKITVIV